MGYSVTFKPTEEAISKIKPWNADRKDDNMFFKNDLLYESKMDILLYCLADHSSEGSYNLVRDLGFKLKYIMNLTYDETKEWCYRTWKNDGEITFYGWRYSKEECGIDEEWLYKNTIEKLLILSKIVKTPDYFDENERFFEKVQEICDEIDGYAECLNEINDFKIIELFREFKVNDDDEWDKEEEDEVPENTISEYNGNQDDFNDIVGVKSEEKKENNE